MINSLNRHPERKNNTHKLFAVLTYRGSGDIIFAQTRVGKNGKLFKIYKFRTMIMDAEKKSIS